MAEGVRPLCSSLTLLGFGGVGDGQVAVQGAEARGDAEG